MSFLGILSLDTAFPRISGDAGNPDSYPCPARVCVVPAAESPRIVRDGPPDPELVDRFIKAAQTLEAEGAAAIVSTCGFLISVQDQIAAAVRIPVMLSALSLYPTIASTCPGRIGILTASRSALGPKALKSAAIPPGNVAIAGLDHDPTFAATFLAPRAAQKTTLDAEAMEKSVLTTARTLISDQNPSALLLECGNLPPYAEALKRDTGLPVFHLIDAAALLMQARHSG